MKPYDFETHLSAILESPGEYNVEWIGDFARFGICIDRENGDVGWWYASKDRDKSFLECDSGTLPKDIVDKLLLWIESTRPSSETTKNGEV